MRAQAGRLLAQHTHSTLADQTRRVLLALSGSDTSRSLEPPLYMRTHTHTMRVGPYLVCSRHTCEIPPTTQTPKLAGVCRSTVARIKQTTHLRSWLRDPSARPSARNCPTAEMSTMAAGKRKTPNEGKQVQATKSDRTRYSGPAAWRAGLSAAADFAGHALCKCEVLRHARPSCTLSPILAIHGPYGTSSQHA